MHFTITNSIKYKIVHREDIDDLWKGFERLVEGTAGEKEIFVRGSGFGEIAGDSSKVLETAFMRKQPVEAITFVFRSRGYDSKLEIYLNNQDTGLDARSSYTVSSSDEQWFNAKCREIDNLIQPLPSTNILGRILNSWVGWVLGFGVALGVFPVALIVLSKTKYSGIGAIPSKEQAIWESISLLLCTAVPLVQWLVVGKLFPLFDMDIFQVHAVWKQRIKKLIVWLVTIIVGLGVTSVIKKLFQ